MYCDDERKLEEFRNRAFDNLALDHSGALVYLAPSRVNLELTIERWPDIRVPRDARARDLKKSPAHAAPVYLLGPVRLGELRVRDHRHGRLLPAVLQAVLERRRRRRPRARSASGWRTASASLVVALLAPLVGAIADKGGARVRLLALFTVLGAAMTAALYLVAKGDWVAASLLYVGASLGFWGGNQFYDSLITDVARAATSTTSSRGTAIRSAISAAACCSRSTW